MLWISIGLVFGLACLGGAAVHASRRSSRQKASRLMDGEKPLLRLDGVTARIYVDRDLLGGPTSDGVNRALADVVLTPRRLLVATHQGRLLELTQQTGGSVRNTGPNRLVIEGPRRGPSRPPRRSTPLAPQREAGGRLQSAGQLQGLQPVHGVGFPLELLGVDAQVVREDQVLAEPLDHGRVGVGTEARSGGAETTEGMAQMPPSIAPPAQHEASKVGPALADDDPRPLGLGQLAAVSGVGRELGQQGDSSGQSLQAAVMRASSPRFARNNAAMRRTSMLGTVMLRSSSSARQWVAEASRIPGARTRMLSRALSRPTDSMKVTSD